MIVYGTRATLQKTEYIFDPCPNCRTANSVRLSVFQRYAHVFWIPFFPIGKTGVSMCNNCRQVIKLDQMPPSLRLSYDNLKAHTKIPIWSFAGVLLISLGVIAIIISEKQTAEKVSKFIVSPKKDDIYEIKLKDSEYTLYKVQKVEKDTVYFFANKYQTDLETGLSGLADSGAKAFDTDITYGLSKSMLADMNKKDEIIDIDRN
jgi:hypothetical protein